MTPKTAKQDTPADPLALSITDEPYDSMRSVPVSKYHATFAILKPGQRIVCDESAVAKVKCALDKWLHHQGHKSAVTRAKLRCPDGKGGVWWMAPPLSAPATHWQPAHNPLARPQAN